MNRDAPAQSLVSPRTSIHMRLSVAVSRSASGMRSSLNVPCRMALTASDPCGFVGGPIAMRRTTANSYVKEIWHGFRILPEPYCHFP